MIETEFEIRYRKKYLKRYEKYKIEMNKRLSRYIKLIKKYKHE